MDNLALLRERAELRGELDAAADQIVELQSKIAGDSARMPDTHCSQVADDAASREQQQALVPRLREELVQALRDNELLRQAIGKGAIREQQGVVGHRTVSSTQLASAARSGLSAQQRWEVQDMVRRQENVRKSQADAFEEQILTLKRERDNAQSRLADAESRLRPFSRQPHPALGECCIYAQVMRIFCAGADVALSAWTDSPRRLQTSRSSKRSAWRTIGKRLRI